MDINQFLLNFKYAFSLKKPACTLRLAEAVIKSRLSSRPRLRYVDFAIDFACNLKCRHCFATVLKQDGRRRMEPQDYASVAAEAMAMGAVNFSFQGGETLLDRRLPDIIRACRPEKNVVSVTTNGTLLDDANLAMLKRTGVNILTVSLDSSIPQEHDMFRGAEGTYKRTVEGLERALKAGFRVSVGTVVTHQSLHGEGIRGLIDFAAKKHLLLYLIFPVPAGNWLSSRDMLLTGEDVAYVESLTAASPYIRTDFQANLGPRGCGAAKEILYLTPYGDVLTCPFIHIHFGNIFEDKLSDIRDRMLSVPEFARYSQTCLAATDPDFIRDNMSKTFGATRLPIYWKEVFK